MTEESATLASQQPGKATSEAALKASTRKPTAQRLKAAANAAKSRQPRTMQSYQKDFYKTYYVYNIFAKNLPFDRPCWLIFLSFPIYAILSSKATRGSVFSTTRSLMDEARLSREYQGIYLESRRNARLLYQISDLGANRVKRQHFNIRTSIDCHLLSQDLVFLIPFSYQLA